MQAAQREGSDSHTTGTGDEDEILFLADLPSYSPMETMVVPDAVIMHEGGDLKNNMSAALVSTQEALKIAITNLQHLADSLPQAGNSAVEYICPVLNSIIEKINEHSE